MNIVKQSLLYSGKAKSLFTTNADDLLFVEYRDDTTAFDGEKKQQLHDKGKINNLINTHIMQHLESAGIPTHFHSHVSATESIVRKLEMIPVECVVRNVAAGSLCRRLGVSSGMVLNPPLFELFLKDDALHDPLINTHHAVSFGWANDTQLERMQQLTLQINTVLSQLFADAGMLLVDAKFEFGVADGTIYLGDEISPDSCRIWDIKTQKTLDKDRFRQDMGQVVESYFEVAERLGIELERV